MSTFDYATLKTTVDALMTEFGRSVTLEQRSRAANNAAEPWKGPDPVADPNASLTTDAVFVPPNTVRQFGLTALGEGTEMIDLVRFSEQIVIIAQDADIRGYDTLVDGNVDWSIWGFQVLRPGDIYMLSFLGVRR